MASEVRVARPTWLRARVPGGQRFENLKRLVRSQQLHTVCEEDRKSVV